MKPSWKAHQKDPSRWTYYGEFETPEFGKDIDEISPDESSTRKKIGRVIAIFPDHLAGLCWSSGPRNLFGPGVQKGTRWLYIMGIA